MRRLRNQRMLVGMTFALACSFVPALSHGAELHYGHIEEIAGDTIHIEYRSPGEDSHFLCNTTSKSCTEHEEEETKNLFPTLLGKNHYFTNAQGTVGLVEMKIPLADRTKYLYSIYDISSDVPLFKAMAPYNGQTNRLRFGRDGSGLVMTSPDGRAHWFEIKSGRKNTITIPDGSLGSWSISPNGSRMAGYDRENNLYRIWNLKNGEVIPVASDFESFVEFSDDNRFAVHLDDKDGYQTLWLLNLENKTHEKLVDAKAVVEDYIFLEGKLYYLANKKSPYTWSLFELDVESREERVISDKASYGDFLKVVNNSLAYVEHHGKNSHVTLYTPSTQEPHIFNVVAPSPLSNKVTRSEAALDELSAVLWEPNTERSSSPVFIWLHGGPHRQTSLAYHPYLSYAVYDELLERLAESGSPVLKLDYSGSFGYSKDFRYALNNNIGVQDVIDVKKASDYVKEQYPNRDIYLIGNSYGGYLSLKSLVDHADTYDGAISINGVTDWFSLIDRIPSSVFKPLFDVADDEARVSHILSQKNAPIYLNANIYTGLSNVTDEPMLIVVGEADRTVPTWQSTNFYSITNALGKNVELLSFEGEDHILRERETLNQLCESIQKTFSLSQLQCS